MKKLLVLLALLMAFIGTAFGAVNVNTASQSELEALAGIGPVKAKAIVDYREKNGAFRSLDDLDKVPGIGKATLEKMRPDVTFSGANTGVSGAPPAKSAREKAAKPGTAAAPSQAIPEPKAAPRTETPTATREAPKAAETKAEKAARKKEEAAQKKADAAQKKTEATKKKADAAQMKTEAAQKKKEAANAKASTKASGEVDINSASAKALANLPGIGATRAKAIVKGRPYRGKDDLVAKKILSQNVYDGIKDQIVARQK
jgi:competence protein ComEA